MINSLTSNRQKAMKRHRKNRLLTHSKRSPSCRASTMLDIPTGIMITAIMIMATVKMNDNFLIARYTPFLFCYIVTASPEAPREKRLGEPFGSDLYKKAPNDCNCLHSMSALVAITGHDSIVKRRDSPFSFRYLCFLLEESIRKQKVPER